MCSLEDAGTAKERVRARFVGQGYGDKMKPFIVHNNHTLRQSSTKIIMSVAAVRQFRVCLLDVTQAYLQSRNDCTREIYNQTEERTF